MKAWYRAVFILALILPVHAFADGATLYLLPYYGVYSVGETFQVHVVADTANASINAAEAVLSYDYHSLEVESISVDDSILHVWPTPAAFSNTDGTIRFSGLTNGEYKGDNGELITITFRALRNMTSSVKFLSGDMLTSDGSESNIVSELKSGLFTIQPKETDGEPDTPADTPGVGTTTAAATDTTSATSTNTGVSAPVLTTQSQQLRVGDRIVVEGKTEPDATIAMWLQHESDQPHRTDLMSNADGSFEFSSDALDQEGQYHLWASAIAKDGTQSDVSKTIDIVVLSSNLASSALFAGSILSSLMQSLALIMVGALIAGFGMYRHMVNKARYQIPEQEG